ncbi:hypothetical protein IKJ53_02430, partial [bacterium]|nr:hypothetical protein [bacterium]
NSTLVVESDLTLNSKLEFVAENQLIGDESSLFINNGLDILIMSDVSHFKGVYEQNVSAVDATKLGNLTLYTNKYNNNDAYNGVLFSGKKNINSGSVTIYDGGTNYYDAVADKFVYGDFILDSNTKYTNYSKGGSVISKIMSFKEGAVDVVATYTNITDSDASERAEYNLHVYAMETVNKIMFRNSNVTIMDTNYSDATEYIFGSNSIVNTKDNGIKSYTFASLKMTDNAKVSMDMDLSKVKDNAKCPVPVNPEDAVVSDTFVIGANSEGNFIISDINFYNYDLDHLLGMVQVLLGASDKMSLVLDTLYQSTPVWTKAVKEDCFVDGVGYVTYIDTFLGSKGIREAKYEGSTHNDSNEIYIMEQKDVLNEIVTTETEQARFFRFREYELPTPPQPDQVVQYIYSMSRNLDNVTSGLINIEGLNKETSIIDAKNSGSDEKYSMFILPNATEMTISNVTIRNSVASDLTQSYNSSVLTVLNKDAVVNINNVVFEENTGYAMYSNAGTINMNTVEFKALGVADPTGVNNSIYLVGNDAYLNILGTNAFGVAIKNVDGTVNVDGTNVFSSVFSNTTGIVTIKGNNTFNGLLSNERNGNVDMQGYNIFANLTGNMGGAIYNNASTLKISNGEVKFIGNYATQGGAIYLGAGSVADITAIFGGEETDAGNTATQGGAVYITGANDVTLSGSFINNSSELGGAIYSDSSFTIRAVNNEQVLFKGNVVNGVSNAIYMDQALAATPVITLKVGDLGNIDFYDIITGYDALTPANRYGINIVNATTTDTDHSYVKFYNYVNNANITINDVVVDFDPTVALITDATTDDEKKVIAENFLKGTSITHNGGSLTLNSVALNNYSVKNTINALSLTVNSSAENIPSVTLKNVVVRLSDANLADLSLNSANNTYLGKLMSVNTEYSIDVIFTNDYTIGYDGSILVDNGTPNMADTIEISAGSSGIIKLTSINFVNVDRSNIGVIQIIKGDLHNSSITLDMSDELKGKIWDYSIERYQNVDDDKIITVKYTDFIGRKELLLAKSDETLADGIYDSIEVRAIEPPVDLLSAINKGVNDNGDLYEMRNFNFTTDYDLELYRLLANTGVTGSGIVNINGIAGKTDIIDALGQFSMFVVSETGVTINLNDVTIKNAVMNNNIGATTNASVLDITATDAVVNISGVIFDNNAGNAIYNAAKINLANVTFTASDIENNNVGGGAIVNKGELTVVAGTNSFGSDVINDNQFVIGAVDNVDNIINTVGGLFTNNSIVTSYQFSSTTFNGGIVANTGSEFNFGGNDVLNSVITLGNMANPQFNILGQLTVTQNSGIADDNIVVNIKDAGVLKIVGSEVLMNTVTNDTWATTGKIILNNYIDNANAENNRMGYLKYVGKDISGNNGVLVAESGKFELVSGVFDFAGDSSIADIVDVILTSGIIGLNKNGLTLSAGDVWTTDANVAVADNVTLNIASGLNGNSILDLTSTSKLSGYEDQEFSPFATLVNDGVTINVKTDESSIFRGTYIQKSGALNVINNGTETGRIFGEFNATHSLKDIQGGSVTVDYTGAKTDAYEAKIDYGNIKLGSNTSLTNITYGGIVNSDVFTFAGENAVVTMTAVTNDDLFELDHVVSEFGNNTIKFVGTEDIKINVLLNQYDYVGIDNVKKTSYVYENAIVSLEKENVDDVVYISDYKFTSLSTNESVFAIDVDMSNMKSDTLKINSVYDSSYDNIIRISKINFANQDQHDGGVIRILIDKVSDITLALTDEMANWTSDYTVYGPTRLSVVDDMYHITINNGDFLGTKAFRLVNCNDVTSTNESTFDGIEIYNLITLDIFNEITKCNSAITIEDTEVGLRQFVFSETNKNYDMTMSLENVGAGRYDIIGYSTSDTDYTIIDAGVDTHYSLFNILEKADATEDIMNVSDVWFKNAGLITDKSASVFNIEKTSAKVYLSHVRFTNNAGNAINNSGIMVLNNVLFDAPEGADNNANGLYNTGTIYTSLGVENGRIELNSAITNTGIINFGGEVYLNNVLGGDNGTLNIGYTYNDGVNDKNINSKVIITETASLTANQVVNLSNGSIIENAGSLYINDSDVWNGEIVTTGFLEVIGVVAGANSTIDATDGTVIINDTIDENAYSSLNVISTTDRARTIAKQVTLTLAKQSIINVIGSVDNFATVYVDSSDKWLGTINLENDYTEITIDGVKTNGNLNANAGNIKIINGSEIILNENSSINNQANIKLESSKLEIYDHKDANMLEFTAGDNWNIATIVLHNADITIDTGLNGGITEFTFNENNVVIGDETSKLTNKDLMLNIVSDQSVFKGKYIQDGGSLTVESTAKMFTGKNYINNGTFKISRLDVIDYANIIMNGNNTEFTSTSLSENGGNVSRDVVSLGDGVTGVNINFMATTKANYVLQNGIDNGEENYVTFNNSNVYIGKLQSNGNTFDISGGTIYKFNDSVVNLTAGLDDGGYVNDYEFSNMQLTGNSSYVINFDLYTLKSDTLRFDKNMVDALSEQVIMISNINFLTNEKAFAIYDPSAEINSVTVQVLFAEDNRKLAIGNDVNTSFEYLITSDVDYNQYIGTKKLELCSSNGADNTDYDSFAINIDVRKDTLQALNMKIFDDTNTKNFNFTELKASDDDGYQTYEMYGNTGSSTRGVLNING